MRCKAAGFSRKKLRRELRDMLIADAYVLVHSLSCGKCDSRDLALNALRLADWDELDYLEALWGRRNAVAEGT